VLEPAYLVVQLVPTSVWHIFSALAGQLTPSFGHVDVYGMNSASEGLESRRPSQFVSQLPFAAEDVCHPDFGLPAEALQLVEFVLLHVYVPDLVQPPVPALHAVPYAGLSVPQPPHAFAPGSLHVTALPLAHTYLPHDPHAASFVPPVIAPQPPHAFFPGSTHIVVFAPLH
jgi:hypothetical protein